MKYQPSLTIGIFGYYSSMNFGDDLMAFIFSKYLASLKVNHIIFTNNEMLGEKYDMNIEPSISNFLEKVNVVVIGGGGLLIPRKGTDFSQFSLQIQNILDFCQIQNVPIYGISIGGNGVHLNEITPLARRRLVSEATYVTLRNPQDLGLLQETSTPGEFYHDIVWATPKFIPEQTRQKNNPRIGINMYFGAGIKSKLLKKIIQIIIKQRQDCEFIFIEVTPVSPDFSFNRKTLDLSSYSDNCSRLAYSDVINDVVFIQSLDLLFTTRLHLGVVAMSYGITAISFLGEEKAKLLFKNVGLEHLVWEIDGFYKLLYYFLLPGQLKKLTASIENLNLQEIINNSMNHLKKLTELITKIDDSKSP